MLYFSLFQEAEGENDNHKNHLLSSATFLALLGKSWAWGGDLPTDTPKVPAWLEGDQPCQDPMGPCQPGSTLGKGIPALLPALFIACEQTSAGPCDDAPPAARG